MITFIAKDGKTIHAHESETSRMGKVFSIEVVDKGECVDHFTLYGQEALTLTAARRGWKSAR